MRSILVFFFGLLLANLSPASGADIRLGDDVIPVSQAIRLKLDADQSDYSGSVSVELEVVRTTSQFLLHSAGHEIHDLVLRNTAGVAQARHESEGGDILRVVTQSPLAPGRYTLEIDFSGPFGTQAVGLYRIDHDGAGYSFTQFQVNDARRAFPCWDEPRFKIPYQMTLAVPAHHVAVSNTAVAKETSTEGWRTLHFKPTRPLPSYLLAIATGPLESVEVPGLSVPARLYTVAGQTHLTPFALQVTPPLLKALEDYFATRLPYDKVDFIAVPEFWPGAMENAGAIMFSDGVLLMDPEKTTINRRRWLAIVMTHELAHQWFGDLVTLEWWDDMWLNEAFADWMGEKIAHQVYPDLGLDIRAVRNIQRILERDARSTTEPIRKKVESVGDTMRGLGLTYTKGNAVLNMFEQWLGPEVFRRGVNTYLKTHAWGNATASDLWAAFDRVSGKNVSQALATFIEQPGFARIDVELLGAGRVKLSQERFRNHGSKSQNYIWQMPLTLKYPMADGVATKTVFFAQASLTFDLDLPDGSADPEWIYPNADARGYFRWNLAPPVLEELASQSGAVLSPRERIELLGNVAALLDAGAISGGDYLEVISRLATDPDLSVVQAVMGELGSVEAAFVSPELEEAFARYVGRMLGPAMERVGLVKKAGEDDEVTIIRPGLIRRLGETAKDKRVLAHGKALARGYMKDPTSVEPELAGLAVALAARDGDQKLFDLYRQRFEAAETPAERRLFLSALGAFEDPAVRQAALTYSRSGAMRPGELFSIAFGMMSDEAGQELVYQWFSTHYDEIMQQVPPLFASRMPFLAGGCSLEHLERLQKFFAQPEHNVPGTDQEMAKVAQQVKDCVTLRQREKEAVSRYLLELGADSP